MAKYTRHDPRNRKRNKHKNETKDGRRLRLHRVDNDSWTRNNLKSRLNQLEVVIDSEVT